MSFNNIYIFHHIYCNEYTMNIIDEQVTKIIFSGLYKKVDKIYCFLTGDENYISICENFLKNSGSKFTIAEIGINDTSYERFTLLKIRNYINPNDVFLYIHTKGARNLIDPMYPDMQDSVEQWRDIMEYFLIAKHEICLEKLNEYETVGINFFESNEWWWKCEPHYSGNFWWCKSDYFLTLDNYIDTTNYYAPETYLMSKSPKHYDLYDSGLVGNHYFTLYPFNKYIDN